LSEEDWPPSNLSIVKAQLTPGIEDFVHEWSHTIEKGDWIEYDGPEDPGGGLLKGMKGQVIQAERFLDQQFQMPMQEGTFGDVNRAFVVEWVDRTRLQTMTVDRSMTKPSTPYSMADRHQEAQVHHHHHQNHEHKHYTGAPMINIENSVIKDSTITAKKGSDGK